MAFINGPVPESLVRRVTATPREFERDLRQAWPAVQGSAEARRFDLQDGAQDLVIDIEAAGVRRLGLFELPQLDVHYRFGPGDEAARRALLARLDRAMQKGGG
ncbi:MAG TPA: hypothetical protein PLF79_08105 [Thauera sp.]|uniref:hypothetical protein n=1 Tax=Thauera sp. TaxID=1905334 RepID=UPI002CA0B6B2|nr:hypothetical protein [Thauera sp.]HRP25087.1 hypothetical protein [Thauera sp.]HRP66022.1 hypothetical protein [Thauera sp.]